MKGKIENFWGKKWKIKWREEKLEKAFNQKALKLRDFGKNCKQKKSKIVERIKFLLST